MTTLQFIRCALIVGARQLADQLNPEHVPAREDIAAKAEDMALDMTPDDSTAKLHFTLLDIAEWAKGSK